MPKNYSKINRDELRNEQELDPVNARIKDVRDAI